MTILSKKSVPEYNAIQAANHSRLKLIDKSPAHYQTGCAPINPQVADFGQLVHTLTLEPETYKEKVAGRAVYDGIRRGKKWEEFQALNKGKEIITVSELMREDEALADARACADAAREQPQFRALLGRAESTFVEYAIEFEYLGLSCKARPDLVIVSPDDSSYIDARSRIDIVDLKSCRDASPTGVALAAEKYGYWTQAAFYVQAAFEARELLQSCSGVSLRYHLLCVEKVAPFAAGMYTLDVAGLESAQTQNEKRIARVHACSASNFWPGYESQMISRPKWSTANQTDEDDSGEW